MLSVIFSRLFEGEGLEGFRKVFLGLFSESPKTATIELKARAKELGII